MNPIHQAFGREACIKLTLDGLLDAMDKMEPDERFHCFTFPFMEVLAEGELKANASDYDTGYEQVYQRFRTKCLQLANYVFPTFLAYSILSRALALMCQSAREDRVSAIVANNRKEIEQAQAKHRRHEITESDFDRIRARFEEVNNNLEGDRRTRERRYNRFCETVVRPLLSVPPTESI